MRSNHTCLLMMHFKCMPASTLRAPVSSYICFLSPSEYSRADRFHESLALCKKDISGSFPILDVGERLSTLLNSKEYVSELLVPLSQSMMYLDFLHDLSVIASVEEVYERRTFELIERSRIRVEDSSIR